MHDFDRDFSKAYCVYFATYFRMDSPKCKDIYNLANEDEKELIRQLWDIKKEEISEETR